MLGSDCDDKVSYLLPLDSLDVTYIHKCLKNSKNEVRPIWSTDYLHDDSKYYCIEIHSMNIDDNDSSYEEAETYKCHICNKDVPKMYYKEHNESETHLIFKRICENILERVSRQLDVNIHDKNVLPNNNHYCDVCNKVVKTENKFKHTQTDYHMNNVEKNKILNNFFKTFLNVDNDSDVANRKNSKPVDNKLDEVDNNSNFINGSNNCDFDDDHSIYTDVDTNDDDDTSSRLTVTSPQYEKYKEETEHLNILNSFERDERQTKSPELKKPFELYLKEIIAKYKIGIVQPQTEGEFIIYENPMKEKFKVSRIFFHSFKDIDNKTYCQICKCVFIDMEEHETAEDHVMKIFKPVNENFAREIDHVYSHCLVCNEVIITQSDHHKISDVHKYLLNQNGQSTTKDNDTNTQNLKPKPHKIFCGFCNEIIDSYNFSEHCKSRRHKKSEETVLELNKITKKNNENFYCNVCQLNLDNYSINSHVKDIEHISKNTQPVILVYDICDVCNVKVPKGGMSIHLTGALHVKRSKLTRNAVNIYQDIEDPKPGSSQNINGKANTSINPGKTSQNLDNKPNIANNHGKNTQTLNNNSSITNNPVSNSKNVNNKAIIDNNNSPGSSSQKSTSIDNKSKESNNKTLKTLNYHKLLKDTDKDTIVKCTVCDCKVPNNERNIIEHMKGTSHEKQMNHYYRMFKYTDASKTKIKCRVCDVDLPFNFIEAFEHIKSDQHKTEFDKLLDYHEIYQIINLSFCNTCVRVVDDCFDHINTVNHTEKFMEKYNVDKELVIKYVYNKHFVGGEPIQYRELYENILVTNKIDKLENNMFYCNVCKIKLTRISEIDHVFGERHKLERDEQRSDN